MRRAIGIIFLACCLMGGCSLPVMAAQAPAVPQSQRAAVVTTPVYVAVGASDSFGIGTDDPLTQSWPHDIAGKLTPAPHLINLGIPGATVDLASRAELPIALDAKPTLVTVWLGVNDFDDNVPLATYSQQLRALLATLTQQTSAAIYVGNLPDLSLLPHFDNRDQAALAAQVTAWNVAISAACTATGAHLVDIYSRWNDLASHHDYLGPDHFHPSTLGAQRIADLFVQEIGSVP
jgi:acyl-CoA thioesterase-1